MAQIFEFNAAGYLIAAFLLHAMSMLVPFKLPYLIRSLTKSAIAIGLVNVSLLVAWLVPSTTPVIAAGFNVSYFYSLAVALLKTGRTVSLPPPR